MPKRLSEAQISAYRRDGYLFPLDGIPAARAEACRAELEAFEAAEGERVTAPKSSHRYKVHALYPWANKLARDPAILDVVEDILGPNLLVWMSTLFIKEPHTPSLTLWHQDATYFGLRPHEHLTAWVALSPSKVESGCMRFLSENGAGRQMRHRARADKNSINGGGQTIIEDFADEGAVDVELRPGQFSLHHTLCIHGSGPNVTDDRRIGIGISYIPTHVRHIGTIPQPAMLVRGEDRYGHFRLEGDPANSIEANRETHARIYKTYRAGYNEQIDWHTEGKVPA